MSHNLFQDMVRIKKAGQFKPEFSKPETKYPEPEKPKIKESISPQENVLPKNSRSSQTFVNSAPKEPKIITKDEEPEEDEGSETEFASVYDLSKNESGSSGGSRNIWILAFLCVFTLVFALSWFFSEAKVTVVPKSVDLNLDKNFFSTKSAVGSDLAFEIISVAGEVSREVEGAEEKMVSTNAKGRVIIYNNFSSATQRLDINTRLEGSNGKIYKTEKQVVVPGKKSDGTPGSIEVNVYASEPGDSYNSGPLDFTVFGFKGTPKYSKFYARSKTDMTGGEQGLVKTVPADVQASVLGELKNSLTEDLTNKAQASIPEGFILFHGATSLNVDGEEVVSKEGAQNMAEIKVSGSLEGFLFNEKKLTEKIAEVMVEDYDGGEVFIPGIDSLAFAIYDKDALNFIDTKNLTFNLSGAPKLVWRVDENKLLGDLMGRSKKDISQILTNYTNIVTGSVSLKPFWRNSLPEKRGDIKLIIEYPPLI